MTSPLIAAGGVYVVIPVHNRRKMTLSCLARLQTTGVLAWAKTIVVDDGSSDGTGAAVRESFPQVLVLDGDGNLWWTGGIVFGMKEAMRLDAKVIMWLNDDCQPRPGTMELLARHSLETGAISVGQTITAAGGLYTGWTKTLWNLKPVICPPGERMPCDTFPGNCVAMPRSVVEEVGYPDAATFPHVLADADYGFRAHAQGFKSVLMGDALCDGIDSLNPRATSWLLDDRPATELLKPLLTRTSTMHPKTYWLFCTRYWPILGAIRFAQPYLKFGLSMAVKAMLPRKLLIQIFGRHSLAWKSQQKCNGTRSLKADK